MGMSPNIPPEISGQRYISLATFRKTGIPVYTPVWFGEGNGRLYVMTNGKSGKSKRLRNNPEVRICSLYHAREGYRPGVFRQSPLPEAR
jgi:PPOX class probable F420-dependent enzyme